MARGLSDLQKHILTTAYQNSIREDLDNKSARLDVYTSEIKHGFYQFPTKSKDLHRASAYGGHDFKLKGKSADIPIDKYKSASVAISKAFASLQRRGLVTRWQGTNAKFSGIRLTEEGAKLAEILTVKTSQDNSNG